MTTVPVMESTDCPGCANCQLDEGCAGNESGIFPCIDYVPIIVEIIGPDNKVHYRRPFGHPDIAEAEDLIKRGFTPGYRINYCQCPAP